jgi:hypothetical protein
LLSFYHVLVTEVMFTPNRKKFRAALASVHRTALQDSAQGHGPQAASRTNPHDNVIMTGRNS